MIFNLDLSYFSLERFREPPNNVPLLFLKSPVERLPRLHDGGQERAASNENPTSQRPTKIVATKCLVEGNPTHSINVQLILPSGVDLMKLFWSKFYTLPLF